MEAQESLGSEEGAYRNDDNTAETDTNTCRSTNMRFGHEQDADEDNKTGRDEAAAAAEAAATTEEETEGAEEATECFAISCDPDQHQIEHEEPRIKSPSLFSRFVDSFPWVNTSKNSAEDSPSPEDVPGKDDPADDKGIRLGLCNQSQSLTGETPPVPVVRQMVEQTTQTVEDPHTAHSGRPLQLITRFMQKLTPKKHVCKRLVTTSEESTQTDPAHIPTAEEFAQMAEEEDEKLAATVVLTSFYKTKSLDLTKNPINNGNILDKVLRKHPKPSVLEELVIHSKYKLCDVPATIGMFDNLVVLHLRDNAIAQLPWTLALLKKLERLDLSYNLLRQLPKVIGSLVSLKDLNVEANHLLCLPTELLKLTKLQTINVLQNSRLRSPPLTQCSNGVETLFLALQKRLDRRNMWEGQKAWIGIPDAKWREPRTLLELCTEAVVAYKVDFLSTPYIPPTVKNYLLDEAKDYDTKIDVAKCSGCKRFFSCRETFENHHCNHH